MKKKMGKRSMKPIIIPILIIGIAVAAWYYTRPVPIGSVYYGEIHGKSYDVVASVPGKVTSIAFAEGDMVKASDIVAGMDDTAAKAAYDKAQAAQEVAQARYDRAALPARDQEVAIQSYSVDQLQSQINALYNSRIKMETSISELELANQTATDLYNLKKDNYDKLLVLYQEGIETETILDKAENEMNAAEKNVETGQLQIEAVQSEIKSINNQITALSYQRESAKEGLSLVEEGAIEEDLAILEKQSELAYKDVDLAAYQLSLYQVQSYHDGKVESINFEVGEFAAAGAPILTLVDTDLYRVTIYIHESDLNKVAAGKHVQVESAGGSEGSAEGTIVHVAEEAMYTPSAIVTVADREKLVFKVELELAKTDIFKPGMLAKVDLDSAE